MRTRFCDKVMSGGPAAKVVKIIGLVILGVIGFAALAFIFGLVIQWLWNHLMPAVFGLPEISYWQAVGLAVLARIFFGCEHNKHVHRHKEAKREKTGVSQISIDCGSSSEIDSFKEFWDARGKDAFRSWLDDREEYQEED